MTTGTAYCVGAGAGVAERLADLLGRPVHAALPDQPRPGDLVFLAARASGTVPGLPGGNAFSACRAIKRDPRVRVFVLVERGDPFGAEIARFCMADGSVELGPDGRPGDLSIVTESLVAPVGRIDTDELLRALEQEMAADRAGRASTLGRMSAGLQRSSLIDQLTDPTTGLFGGPFAGFKLDEEFKRASRFHQPLSLILLDIGERVLPEAVGRRDMVLAEAAAVFLNECRDIDVLARFTETTFLFLLPGTGPTGAATVAHRMIDGLTARPFGDGVELTPRAGIATVPAAGVPDRAAFLGRAAACLRLAQAGRGERGVCVSCE